jgi:hypothetical protein
MVGVCYRFKGEDMNEQIGKLWDKTCEEIHPEMDGICMTNQRGQKFAQLIVQECVGVAVDNGCGDFVDIEHLLLKHFGVEL